MKRYMVFFGHMSNGIQEGGMRNFKGSFDSLKDAMQYVETNRDLEFYSVTWCHIYDLNEEKIVLTGSWCYYYNPEERSKRITEWKWNVVCHEIKDLT